MIFYLNSKKIFRSPKKKENFMEENEKTSKEKLVAFWSVKRNKIITCSVGGVLLVGIVLAIVLPIALAHTHTFAKKWESDKTYHWHEATCGDDVVDGKAEHTFKEQAVAATYEEEGYTLYTCEVCDYSYKGNVTDKLTHNYASTWSSDKDSHWHACTDKGYENLKKDEANHTFTSKVTEPTYEEKGYTTYTCSVCSYSYTADETPSGKEQEELKKKYGIIPVFDTDNQTVTYGMYPQTHVNDADTISALDALTSAEDNGWYKYNDEYYAKLSANPYDSSSTFRDGVKIEKGKPYWFKCETIKWKILEYKDGTYSLLSTVILDTHRYDDDSNVYKDSEIRNWLNGDFYNTAFYLGSSNIVVTEVDNSAATTGVDPNQYATENTFDNVYLLSYKDYLNADYGFATSVDFDSSRECKVTDFGCANYAQFSFYYAYNGYYWTRSPYTYSNTTVRWVYHNGDLNACNYSTESCVGVRPAITIKL